MVRHIRHCQDAGAGRGILQFNVQVARAQCHGHGWAAYAQHPSDNPGAHVRTTQCLNLSLLNMAWPHNGGVGASWHGV